MIGGFGGMRDPMGTVSAPGWAASALPVSNDNGDGVSYDSLKVEKLKIKSSKSSKIRSSVRATDLLTSHWLSNF